MHQREVRLGGVRGRETYPDAAFGVAPIPSGELPQAFVDSKGDVDVNTVRTGWRPSGDVDAHDITVDCCGSGDSWCGCSETGKGE